VLILNNLTVPVLRAGERERARKGMEAKDLTRICGAGNKKSGREAAAIGKYPHSYAQSIVPNEVKEVKKFLGSVLTRTLPVIGCRWDGAARTI